jgi:hypothetical protein
MSRNLCRTSCDQCGCRAVRLTANPYHRKDRGGTFADAECRVCGVLYTAWMRDDEPPHMWGERAPDGFFDLSYRSTFNDEPGPADFPISGRIETFRVVTRDGVEIHREPLDD